MMEELMAPLETDEGKRGQEALLLEDPIAKRKDMTQRELLVSQPGRPPAVYLSLRRSTSSSPLTYVLSYLSLINDL